MEFSHQENQELEKLGQALSALEKPALDQSKKSEMRADLLFSLGDQSQYRALQFLFRLAKQTRMELVAKARLREKLLSALEKQTSSLWSRLFFVQKRFAPALMIFLLVFGLFSFVGQEGRTAEAGSFTRLESFTGQVEVLRGGYQLSVYPGMEILEKDQVITGEDSSVTIAYLDDSVSRFASNSEVLIRHLYADVDNPAHTHVEIDVAEGSVWSRVVNLVEDESVFVVKVSNFKAQTSKAAFNVEVRDEDIEIEVFNNTVEVIDAKNDQPSRVLSGSKVVASKTESAGLRLEELGSQDRANEWVSVNIKEDQNYVENLKKTKLASHKEQKPGLKEGALMLITFDDVDKAKIELDVAEKKFLSTVAKLSEADLAPEKRAELEAQLDDFFNQINEFYAIVDQVARADKEYAAELRKYAKNKLSVQKKNLALVEPDSPAYKAKELVANVEDLSASTKEELVKVRKARLLEKFSEIEEVIATGDRELAKKLAAEYELEVEEVLKMIDKVAAENAVAEGGTTEEKDPAGENSESKEEVEPKSTETPVVVAVDTVTADPNVDGEAAPESTVTVTSATTEGSTATKSTDTVTADPNEESVKSATSSITAAPTTVVDENTKTQVEDLGAKVQEIKEDLEKSEDINETKDGSN